MKLSIQNVYAGEIVDIPFSKNYLGTSVKFLGFIETRTQKIQHATSQVFSINVPIVRIKIDSKIIPSFHNKNFKVYYECIIIKDENILENISFNIYNNNLIEYNLKTAYIFEFKVKSPDKYYYIKNKAASILYKGIEDGLNDLQIYEKFINEILIMKTDNCQSVISNRINNNNFHASTLKTVNNITNFDKLNKSEKINNFVKLNNYNKIRFGKNNSSEQIDNNVSEQIDNNSSEQIDNNVSGNNISEQINVSEQIDNNSSEQIDNNVSEQIDNNSSEQIDNNSSEQINVSDKIINYHNFDFKTQNNQLINEQDYIITNNYINPKLKSKCYQDLLKRNHYFSLPNFVFVKRKDKKYKIANSENNIIAEMFLSEPLYQKSSIKIIFLKEIKILKFKLLELNYTNDTLIDVELLINENIDVTGCAEKLLYLKTDGFTMINNVFKVIYNFEIELDKTFITIPVNILSDNIIKIENDFF